MSDEGQLNREIEAAQVLITVKAYPKPSGKYEELVCTAGLLNGTQWIRIYPVPFRLLADENRYPKYAWIELDLVRRDDKDFRPESFRPKRGVDEDIRVLGRIGTENEWDERRRIVLNNVYTSMDELIHDAYSSSHTSLATLRPKRVVDVSIENSEREWPDQWQQFMLENDLFETDSKGARRPAIRKVPFDFSYKFETEDGKVRELKIEDWELGALYWNCLRRSNNDEKIAAGKVRPKYLDFAKNKDLHFFLGTTLQWHQRRANNPFIIIGVFYPPIRYQQELF